MWKVLPIFLSLYLCYHVIIGQRVNRTTLPPRTKAPLTTASPSGSAAAKDKSPIFEFGDPEIFVTSESQNFDPYRLINKYKRTFMLNEYLIFASSGARAKSQLLLYDPEETDIVKQNLGKEQYWAFINSTGALPSITLYNTTFRSTTSFYTTPDDQISFHTKYLKSSFTKETAPAYDVVFEIPANSKTFHSTKTGVDLQSWGLLRWQLSGKAFVSWTDIKVTVETLKPIYTRPDTKTWDVSPADFKRINNPCLPDFFLLYLIVGDKKSEVHQIYADIPAFHIKENVPNFLNLTGSFCPHFHSVAHEECGFVQELILTNDHLVALTDKGIYVSSSLNTSDADVSRDYEEKPLISYDLVDPCSKFSEYISCFSQGLTSLASQLIHSIRLFYTPICYLYQYPLYEDRMIFVVEHTTTGSDNSATSPPVRAITVLYASTPFKQWKVLFIGIDRYNGSHILGLVGIFFNHQLRHFDLTLKVMENDEKNFHYRRFVLPDLGDEDSVKTPGYSSLNGLMGDGFLEKRFPGTFQLENIVVNPGTMDVFFLGSQLWIAELAGPLVYISVAGLSDGQSIRKCSFNHPDRTFVCVNSDSTRLVVGRVGSRYSPYLVDVETIDELWEAAGLKGVYWTQEFAELVIKNAHYTSAFSGNILMWYLYDPQELRDLQLNLLSNITQADDCNTCSKCKDHIDLVRSCNQLLVAKSRGWLEPQVTKDPRGPYFRMISIDPTKLRSTRESTDGPLVPLFISGRTLLLFEAKLPGEVAEHIYISDVHFGQNILCAGSNNTSGPTVPNLNPSVKQKEETGCLIFIRHIKQVDKFLNGFRQVLHGTVIKPMYLAPVPANITVLQVANDNLVFILNLEPAKFQYADKHIGQTHNFPGHFSVLLQGFPVSADKTIMWGYATAHVRSQKITKHEDYQTFLVDMSTPIYREKRVGTGGGTGANEKEWKEYQNSLIAEQKEKEDFEKRKFNAKLAVQADYEKNNQFGSKIKLFSSTAFDPVPVFDPIGILKKIVAGRKKRDVQMEYEGLDMDGYDSSDEMIDRRASGNISSDSTSSITTEIPTTGSSKGKPGNTTKKSPSTSAPVKSKGSTKSPANSTKPSSPAVYAAPARPSAFAAPASKGPAVVSPWTVSDGGCHHVLQLEKNPVLYSHGGKVSLDLHDALSLEVTLRPITGLGRLLLFRPLIVVSNSNPDILRVEKKSDSDLINTEFISQSVSITLTPTGTRMGVASLVVRSIITSIQCETPTSITFIVQIHRPAGKRLHAVYPIPTCHLPRSRGGISRPWVADSEDCIPFQDILDADDDGINHRGLVKVYTKLATNYRPPSNRGEQIPLSRYIYNADPSKERYNNWYHVTQDSGEYNKCKFRANREDCACTDADKLSDDPVYSDCKELVYTVKRGKAHQMSFELDPLMRDEDQIPSFLTRKDHLSIYIEEINGRSEFTVISCNASGPGCHEESDLLKEINGNENLNNGKKFYDAKNLLITLHGTGLYHFKAGVGKFDSFEDVSGHFTLYSGSNELNHVKLAVVMLITITLCFVLVFCGFLRVRRRLSSHLPFQSNAGKSKLE